MAREPATLSGESLAQRGRPVRGAARIAQGDDDALAQSARDLAPNAPRPPVR